MHSPDGSWWWDGTRWSTALTPDGAWWFDGAEWQPRRRRTFRRRLAGAGVVLAAITISLGMMVLYAWASGEAHDHRSLDDPLIVEAAARGCGRLVTVLTDADGDDVERRVVAGNAAIATLVDDVEALGRKRLADDEPALDWIADWQRLAEARAAFAKMTSADADADRAVFEAPTSDGFPITERMIEVAPEPCGRAVELASAP